MMKGTVILPMLVVVFCIVQCYMVKPTEAVNCGQVDSSMAPCIPYLTSGGAPTGLCCDGVKRIQTMASTTIDRQAACECLKQAAQSYPNLKEDAASALPAKCGVAFNIPISKATNCKEIK